MKKRFTEEQILDFLKSFFVTPRSLLDVLFGFGIVCEGQHRRFVNYDLSYQGNNLTITKALLNVIADAKTKVYRAPHQALGDAVDPHRGDVQHGADGGQPEVWR